MILTTKGVPFHPVVVIGFCKNLLFKSILAHCDIEIYNVCQISIFIILLKKSWIFKYVKNSNFWLQTNVQRPCLKWIDMLYLLCKLLVKKSEKNGEKKKRQKNGRNDFFKKNIKCSTTSHLRHVFLECMVQNYDAYGSLYCLSNNYIFSSKKHTRFQIHQKFKFLILKKSAETLS